MRRFFSFVAFLGVAWVPCMATAQDEPVEADVDVGVQVEPTPPPPPAVVVETEVESPPPAPPDYEYVPEAEKGPGFLAEIQPYGWLPLRMSGDTVFGGARVPTTLRAKDVFENDQLSIGGGLRLEAWAMRFGLITDAAFLQLERNYDSGVQFRSRQFLGDFLAGLRLIQTGPLAGGPSVGVAVTGGMRLVYDRERVGDVTVGNVIERDDWIAKGSLGGDIPIRFSEGFGLRARGQVRYPDFDWSIQGLAEFDALPVGIDVGYRYENLNYEEGPLDTDVDVHTIFLGVALQATGPLHHHDRVD